MKELTENLEKLIDENKITLALKSVELFLQSNSTIDTTLLKLFEKIFQNLSEPNISIRIEILKVAANSNLDPLNFLEGTLLIVDAEDLYEIYPIGKEIFLKNGCLEKFEKLFEKIKKQLLNFKAYSTLINEVESLEELGIEHLLSVDEILLIKFGLGDIEYFEKIYSKALSEIKPTRISHLNIDFENIVWRKQSFVMKEKILSTRESLEVESLKDLLKSVYELLIVDNESMYCLIELIRYSTRMNNKDLALKSKDLLKNQYAYEDKNLSLEIENTKNIERGSFGEIDMGDDLFEDEDEKKDITIRRLVNKINILKVDSDMEGATRLLEQLREIDKDHSLVKEIEEKEYRKIGTKIKKISRTTSEIENDLLLELTKYTTKEISSDNEEENHLERVARKSYELMENEEVLLHYSELLFTFNTLGFYSVSLSLIDRVLSLFEEEDLVQKIELTYLKCETFRMAQNYYGSLNEIEDSLDSLALTDKERVSFYYLKGEVLRELGKKREALKSYAKVYSLDKKFRMVSYRLKEIE